MWECVCNKYLYSNSKGTEIKEYRSNVPIAMAITRNIQLALIQILERDIIKDSLQLECDFGGNSAH
ncbi:MAG: hypothetical protein ACJA2S_001017 [Cyclobacteriaceae bacterium]|jgi:hypothetical protein